MLLFSHKHRFVCNIRKVVRNIFINIFSHEKKKVMRLR